MVNSSYFAPWLTTLLVGSSFMLASPLVISGGMTIGQFLVPLVCPPLPGLRPQAGAQPARTRALGALVAGQR